MGKKHVCLTILVFVLMGLSVAAVRVYRVEAQLQTVYIRANGDVEPSWVPIQRNGDVYTFTGDITVDGDATGMIIERNNMTLDGAGYLFSLSPSLVYPYGIELIGRGNVTIRNLNVVGFAYGIYLHSSTLNIILENNITFNEGNIYLASSSNNTITGNMITDGAEAIQLRASHNNTISNNSMINNGQGVWLRSGSAENAIHGNNITDNTYSGISISGSHNNTISRNILVNNTDAIDATGASSTTITGNMIAENRQNGIAFDNAGYNIVCSNEIKTSSINGISIEGDESTLNMFYHNNIVDNTNQVEVQMSPYGYPPNTWDNGIEGNYWSDYADVDVDSGGDGLGDSTYVIDLNNTDSHPLMGPVSFFDAGTWNEKTYHVHTVSNSTISDFNFNVSNQVVSFNVIGPNGALGFCRVAIPRELLWCDDIFDWAVRVNGTSVPIRIQEHAEHTYLYFTYSHSVQTVEVCGTQVIPEFSSAIILALFITATLLATIVYRRKEPLKA